MGSFFKLRHLLDLKAVCCQFFSSDHTLLLICIICVLRALVFFFFFLLKECRKQLREGGGNNNTLRIAKDSFFFCTVSINYATPFINPLAPVNYSTILASSWKVTLKH